MSELISVNREALESLLRTVDSGGFWSNSLGVGFTDDGSGSYTRLTDEGPAPQRNEIRSRDEIVDALTQDELALVRQAIRNRVDELRNSVGREECPACRERQRVIVRVRQHSLEAALKKIEKYTVTG